jgi:hypothetical protein
VRVAVVLINLGLPPIEDIPQLPKVAWDTFTRSLLPWNTCKGSWTSAPALGTEPLFLPFFSSPLEATVGENMVIYTYIYTYIYIYMFTMEGA